MKKNIKIAVALSGGVDSAVAAKILIDRGFQVIGIFLNLWRDFEDGSVSDAKKVANYLNVPFFEVDMSDKFKTEVVDGFIQQYEEGKTPNPCVICNRNIKFSGLVKKAKEQGCELVATGHYGRVFNPKMYNLGIIYDYPEYNDGEVHLLSAKDNSKDQSYMLYQLSKEELLNIYFPLGELTKSEVRKIAKESNLPVAEKKESQEICFTKKNYRDFYIGEKGEIEETRGDVIRSSGETVGRHSGIFNYTLGQRKGINQDFVKGEGRREKLYVSRIDIKNNRIIVSCDEDVFAREAEITNSNWIRPIDLSREYLVKIRYKHDGERAKIESTNEIELKIVFDKPVRAVTAGQSAVFYVGEEVIGGGIIK